MKDDGHELSVSELAAGWHFCADWDSLLVCPEMEESKFCHCGIDNWPALLTEKVAQLARPCGCKVCLGCRAWAELQYRKK